MWLDHSFQLPKTPFVNKFIQMVRNGYNHDTGRKFGNVIVVLNQGFKNFQLSFSSIIEVPQLSSAWNLHSSGSLEPEIPARTHL